MSERSFWLEYETFKKTIYNIGLTEEQYEVVINAWLDTNEEPDKPLE